MTLPTRSILQYGLLVALVAPPVLAASCARGGTADSGFTTDTASPGGTTPGGGGRDATVPIGNILPAGSEGGTGFVVNTNDGGASKCNAARPCIDFPSTPITDPMGKPATDPSAAFGAPGTGSMTGGPCLVEPADGALFPNNWLRPRILWIPGSKTQNVFEVRIHSDGEKDDLVVYTTNQYYVLDTTTWQTIASGAQNDAGQHSNGNLVGQKLSITVRGMSSAGGMPTISNSASMAIAPAIADGALVYWTTASFDNSATNTTLQGFRVGDEGTAPALQASDVVQPVRASPLLPDGGTGNLVPMFQKVFCIGCHTATPDGDYVAFSAQWPWPSTLASIQQGMAGAVPPWLSRGAVQNLSPDYQPYSVWYNPPAVNQIMLGIGTFSPAHYATGDRMYVATLGSSWNSFSLVDQGVASGVTSQLAWFNLEWDNATTAAGGLLDSGLPAATPCTQGVYPGINGAAQGCIPAPVSNGGWGIVARTGDKNGAGAPSWSHNADGKTDVIAYVSTNVGVKDGRMDCSVNTAGVACAADIYTVPFGSNGPGLGGAGGTATPLPGASDAAYNEYYPAFSPDDKFVAFNRVPKGVSMYDQAKAEVYVVPYNGGMGGMAQPVTSNYPPPACANPYPMGAQNTWPKFAPNPVGTLPGGGQGPIPQTDADGNTYYWLTFSSIRSPTAELNANGKPKQQLYVVGVVVDPMGNVTSYAPIYLWNQSFKVNNLIPAWGEFSIPPGVTPPPMPTAQ
jgi:WD40-like Beta Propeller Repeat